MWTGPSAAAGPGEPSWTLRAAHVVLTDVEVVLVDFGEASGGRGGGEAAFVARGQRGQRVDLVFSQLQREAAAWKLRAHPES